MATSQHALSSHLSLKTLCGTCSEMTLELLSTVLVENILQCFIACIRMECKRMIAINKPTKNGYSLW